MSPDATRTVKLSCTLDVPGPLYAVGTWNNWSVEATPMKKSRNGKWTATLKLQPGEYQYRYFADGRWYTDESVELVANEFGDCNCLLRVAAPKSASRKRQTQNA